MSEKRKREGTHDVDDEVVGVSRAQGEYDDNADGPV